MSQPARNPISMPELPRGVRVLVVDDERALADFLAMFLRRDGFEVSTAYDGHDAIDQARRVDPDVILLDLGLPLIDGVEVCRIVRTFSNCYIIMLTSRTEEVDRVIGLSVGADDYLCKPASPREVVARIRAEVYLEGEAVELTRTEFDVLEALSGQPTLAFSRRQLIDSVWDQSWVGDEHMVDVHVAHLRRKLGDDASSPRFVCTVRGVGYRIGAGT